MKNLILFIGAFLIFWGCQTNEIPNLEGDLYYTWLSLGSFRNQPDSVYQYFNQQRDSNANEEMMSFFRKP